MNNYTRESLKYDWNKSWVLSALFVLRDAGVITKEEHRDIKRRLEKL